MNNKRFYQYHQASKWPPVKEPSISEDKRIHQSEQAISLSVDSLDVDFADCLHSRKTSKTIQPDPHINQQTLGTFLQWTVGKIDREDRRRYPSAGGLYPNQILVAVNEVIGMEAGLYRYWPETHTLVKINQNSEVLEVFVQPDIHCNFCLIIAADLNTASKNYGERGYRFCLLEAGHIVQNCMLVAAGLEQAIAPIGGFNDDVSNQLLSPLDLVTLYLVPVGA